VTPFISEKLPPRDVCTWRRGFESLRQGGECRVLKKKVTESHQPRKGVVMPFAGCLGLIQTGQRSFSRSGSCWREQGSYANELPDPNRRDYGALIRVRYVARNYAPECRRAAHYAELRGI
jgi:hypothetical protein